MELIAKFGLFNGVLALLLIFAYSVFRNKNKIFLALSLFFVWYSLIMVRLNETGSILKYPFFERTGLIAAYLAFPFLYVYSRNTFYPGSLWRKTDWILLLPAAFYIVDFMPFFLMPSNQKNITWIENLADHRKMLTASEGWLPLPGFHFVFIYIWLVVITYFQVLLIAQNRKVRTGFRSAHNKRLLRFVIMITILYAPLFIPGIFGAILKLDWFQPKFIEFSYGLSLTAIAVYLLIYPSILYGFLPEEKFYSVVSNRSIAVSVNTEAEVEQGKVTEVEDVSAIENKNINTATMPELESFTELAIVLRCMENEKAFRQQGFTIQNLSNLTGIPVYQLSPLINRYFNMNFTTWINRYRVEYFIEHAKENKNMTLEALARDAGFTSRSTFISAFKKEKGMTPSEYLRP